MKNKLLLFMFALLCVPAACYADGVAFYTRITEPGGGAAQYPVFTVCADSSDFVTQPCTSKASIYSDVGLSVPLANPSRGDVRGNITFYAAAGVYRISIGAPFVPGYTFKVNLGSSSSTGGGASLTLANAASTGTTANKLVKLTGAPSTGILTATTDAGGVVGICATGCGTTGNATIVTVGAATCVFDGATTAGDYIQISSSTAGDCHDSGSAYPTGIVLGRVLTTNGSGGTYDISIFSPEIRGLVLSGVAGNDVCYATTSTVADCGSVAASNIYTPLAFQNGDFEDGCTAAGCSSAALPSFWLYSYLSTKGPVSCTALGGNCTLTYDTSTPYQGAQALKLVTTTQFAGVRQQQLNSCKPGDQFVVSFAGKYVSGASGAGTFPYVFVVFNEEAVGGTANQPIVGTDTAWHTFILPFTCPAGASNFEVGTHSNSASSVTWEIDNLSVQYVTFSWNLDYLKETEIASPSTTLQSAYVRTTQLTSVPQIQNGDFEGSTSIIPPPGWQVSTCAVLTYDTSSPPEGAQAIRSNGTSCANGSTLNPIQIFTVVAGQTVSVSGYSKYVSGTIGGGDQASIFALSNDGTLLINQAINTSDSNWHAFSYSFVVPSGTWAVHFQFTTSGPDEIWGLDNFQVQGPWTVSTMVAKTYGTATNCIANGTAASPSVVSCSAAAAGMFSCATNATTATCQINTTAVTANSEISITPNAADGGASQLNVTCNTTLTTPAAKPILLSKSAGSNFIINLGTVTTNPA